MLNSQQLLGVFDNADDIEIDERDNRIIVTLNLLGAEWACFAAILRAAERRQDMEEARLLGTGEDFNPNLLPIAI